MKKLPELYSRDLIDAKKVADYLDITYAEMGSILSLKDTGALLSAPAELQYQEALEPIKQSIEILDGAMRDREYVLSWLSHPHPDLGFNSPKKVILDGYADALVTILNNALEGLPR